MWLDDGRLKGSMFDMVTISGWFVECGFVLGSQHPFWNSVGDGGNRAMGQVGAPVYE